jgi:MoxR-like ATPase
MDRFLHKLSTGYPQSLDMETEILRRRIGWKKDDPTDDVKPVMDVPRFRALQEKVERDVFIHDAILKYIGEVVRALRDHPKVEVGPSPRGSLALLRISRSNAFLSGRDFVTPDDVKVYAVEALAHRTILDLEHTLEGLKPEDVVKEVLASIETPMRFKKTEAGVPEPEEPKVTVQQAPVAATPIPAAVEPKKKKRFL